MNSWLIILLMVFVGQGALHRIRRVINGVVLEDVSKSYGRPTTYTAIRYYGAISNSHVYAKWWSFFGIGGTLYCSGSIITPTVFQTACHCLANFGRSDHFIKPPNVFHHWEGRVVIYLGVSNKYGENSMATTTALLSVKFTIHGKCGRLGLGEVNTYDYGVIQVPGDWMKTDDTVPFAWTEIEWAPMYTIRQIQVFYTYALQHQLVCLHIGFGVHYYTVYAPSDVLRHGWAVLQPEVRCIKDTAKSGGVYFGDSPSFMWACGMQFPHHMQPAGSGDSGGPISCNNEYFGVLSGTVINEGAAGNMLYSVTKYHPLTHNLFVNAAEYRQSLIHSIDDLKESYKIQDYDV